MGLPDAERLTNALNVFVDSPFWLCGGSRVVALLFMGIPIITILFLLYVGLKPGVYNLHTTVRVTRAYKKALRVHAFYFGSLSFVMEMFFEELTMVESGIALPKANAMWVIEYTTADFIFTLAAAYLTISLLDAVPRGVLIFPLVQCAYNVKNDIMWALGGTFGPEGSFVSFVALDMAIIWSLFAVYIHHFCTANAEANTDFHKWAF